MGEAQKNAQQRRPRPVAETGRSCWGSGLQDASAVQGTKQTQGAATRRLPRLESSGDLAALNTRHLLRKPVCGLKAPLGLSCPPGTAVLSGSLLVPKENNPRPAPAHRNRRALAALNTRHLLRKPVCGLKVPLGLSCPAGTAVLSGSLLVPKENKRR